MSGVMALLRLVVVVMSRLILAMLERECWKLPFVGIFMLLPRLLRLTNGLKIQLLRI
jgi:hypothetical protein